MDDWEALRSRLMNGKDADALQKLAGSAEARRLSGQISPREAENALRSGDPERLQKLLRQVLSTPEGRSLTEKLSEMGGKKP